VAIKVVGALLIAAMLIIPAPRRRGMARTPESMALMAVLIGAGSSLGGAAAIALAGHAGGAVDHCRRRRSFLRCRPCSGGWGRR
jgi:ABC-type Mn2+/Zn2+ transport system permease subunit